jgi:hypothetical protein
VICLSPPLRVDHSHIRCQADKELRAAAIQPCLQWPPTSVDPTHAKLAALVAAHARAQLRRLLSAPTEPSDCMQGDGAMPATASASAGAAAAAKGRDDGDDDDDDDDDDDVAAGKKMAGTGAGARAASGGVKLEGDWAGPVAEAEPAAAAGTVKEEAKGEALAPRPVQWSAEGVARHLDLFLASCARQPALLTEYARLLPQPRASPKTDCPNHLYGSLDLSCARACVSAYVCVCVCAQLSLPLSLCVLGE